MFAVSNPWQYSFVVVSALALSLAGCGRSDGLVTVKGTVTFNGQPVEDGSISLMPVDGNGIAGGGMISNGRYTAETSPGQLGVQIYAFRTEQKANPTAEEIERGLAADRVQILPAAYNRESKLRIHVTESQRNFDFELNSAGDIPPAPGAS